MNFGILRLYCGASGKKGFYNMQELGLAKELSKLGYHCYIFLLDSSLKKITEETINKFVKIVMIPCFNLGNHGIFKLNVLKKYKINILQIAVDNQFFAPSVIQFCKKNNIKHYNYIGTINTDSKKFVKKVLSKLFILRLKKYYKDSYNFVKTPSVKKELEKINIFNTTLLPVGLDFDLIQNKLSKMTILNKFNLPKGKDFLIFVGRLEEYKQPLELLKLLDNIHNNYHLIIVGKGSLKEKLLSSIERRNFTKNVTYFAQLPNNDVNELYTISRYFINFNKCEVFGMSILEALYAGVTIIAYHAPGPDFILQDNNGFLVENIVEMSEIINKEITLDRKKLIKHVKENFSWKKNALLIDDAINKGLI